MINGKTKIIVDWSEVLRVLVKATPRYVNAQHYIDFLNEKFPGADKTAYISIQKTPVIDTFRNAGYTVHARNASYVKVGPNGEYKLNLPAWQPSIAVEAFESAMLGGYDKLVLGVSSITYVSVLERIRNAGNDVYIACGLDQESYHKHFHNKFNLLDLSTVVSEIDRHCPPLKSRSAGEQ